MTQPSTSLQSALSLLIIANHILDHYGLTDGFGHVSIRDPEEPRRFYMTGNVQPAFVTNADDIAHYKIEDGSPVIPGDPKSGISPWSERFCHSGVYKRYSKVQAVVHSHSRDVIAFGISNVAMKPMFHLSGFLGDHVPTFDTINFFDKTETKNLLVNTDKLGVSLASTLSSKTNSKQSNELPDYPVALQRGHGFTAWGQSIQEAVYHAYYTQENARVQMAATTFSTARTGTAGPNLTSLDKHEIAACKVLDKASVHKAWAYWSRIVEAQPMYKNELQGVRNVKNERDYVSIHRNEKPE